MRTFDIVVAADLNSGIGKDGGLPWHLPGDLAYFKQLTSAVRDASKRNAVIMGRKTWDSIAPKFRPLKGRLNIVLTRRGNCQVPDGVLVAEDLDQALNLATGADIENVFVIGGGAVYEQALPHQFCRLVYLTEVQARFACDTFLPDIEELFIPVGEPAPVARDGDVQYTFKVYQRKYETRYLNSVASSCQ
jgi:dihydrofolate reductase / thymidylate synthase